MSAVVCTRNRAPYLRRCVEGLLSQTLPRSRFEILIVDNGSTDATTDVVRELQGRDRGIRYAHESSLGIAYARNQGWRQASAPLVAYLDDDAIPEADWLEAVLGFFAEHPDAGALGGRIVPIWEREQPDWLPDETARALTILHWSETPRPVNADEWIVAANLAIPVTVLDAIGGFKLNLGRKGGRLLSNEENLARLEIEASGRVCWYDPGVVVRHHVHPERLSKGWFRRRAWWQGFSDAVMERHLEPGHELRRRTRGGMLLAREFVRSAAGLRLLRAPDLPRAFHAYCLRWYRLGYGIGLLGGASE